MKDCKNQTITIHIAYTDEMTLYAMEHSLHILNEALAAFSKEYKIVMSKTNETSPKVKSISNGSLEVDVIVPIVCALLPILYDLIKNKFNTNPKYVINIYSNGIRLDWTEEDNYKVCKQVLKKYVLGKSAQPINDFLLGLSLSRPYSKKSIRAKIQNTKYLLDGKNIPNTIPIASLPNCSITHREQFEKACWDLNI